MSRFQKLKKLKKIRLHREGTEILTISAILLLVVNGLLYWAFDCKLPFYVIATVSVILYLLMVNFFRCPIRVFEQDTEKIVVAPADGKIVVIEEVDEDDFHIHGHYQRSRQLVSGRRCCQACQPPKWQIHESMASQGKYRE